MLEKFAAAMKEMDKKEMKSTENGALGYKTSGTKLVDFNFKMSSYRDLSEQEIVKDFSEVYSENPLLAIKMLFFTGDIRGGMGERRVFNVCMTWLAHEHSDVANAIIELIPEYNRWDSVINLCFFNETKEKAVEFVSKTLSRDIECMNNGESVSLLAKWMPSINTSSKETVKRALCLKNMLGFSNKKYRKTLSLLRKYLDVTEVKMTANKWNEINYEAVPSKANVIYKDAFLNHDIKRRSEYLKKLADGKAKINSGVSFPYDIIHAYRDLTKEDKTLEAMWKKLPNYLKGKGCNTICMVDGSGSMEDRVGKSSLTCMEVAQSLGIYFSERMHGAFQNTFITFSRNPKIVFFNSKWSLREKIQECERHFECSNTDIYKAFMLILGVAKMNKLKQEEIPHNILVLSDMEFDPHSIRIDRPNVCKNDWFNKSFKTLFESISETYSKEGYKMPKLVFWNICGRSNAIPIQENENGVILVSGFSPTIASMVFSTKLNPYDALLEKLNSSRYDSVEESVKNFI